MSESPENKNLPVATDQPQPPAMTPATAAPLIGFAEAVRPLLTEYMRSTHENTHQKQEHEFRMAELDARSDERVQRRVYPLVWFVVAGIAALIGFAARQDNWPVVTHLLAGLLGMVSGVGIGQYRNRQSEPQPADE